MAPASWTGNFEPRVQLPVRGLGFPPEGFVSEMAFLFEPRGLTLSGRQTTGLSCHLWLVERLRPINSLSDQREKRGEGLAATAVSPPRTLWQGHGRLTPPPRQGLPPRARGCRFRREEAPCGPLAALSTRLWPGGGEQRAVMGGRGGPHWGGFSKVL